MDGLNTVLEYLTSVRPRVGGRAMAGSSCAGVPAWMTGL